MDEADVRERDMEIGERIKRSQAKRALLRSARRTWPEAVRGELTNAGLDPAKYLTWISYERGVHGVVTVCSLLERDGNRLYHGVARSTTRFSRRDGREMALQRAVAKAANAKAKTIGRAIPRPSTAI